LALAAELDDRFVSAEWLSQKGGLRRAGVKIHEDVQVAEGAFKAPGGLIRATVRLREGRVDDLELAGDFTIFPAAAVADLQAAARGASLTRDALAERFAAAYRDHAIQAPGVTPEHLAEAVLAAVTARA
jgi:lipoate-protein ligase A